MATTYTVQRSVTIAAEPSHIFPYLADFHRWPAWSPWEGLDPVEPSTVRIDLRFEKPFRSRSESVFTVLTEGERSVVTWTVNGPATLMTRVMGLFTSMDKLLGPDFEKGLTRLRTEVEGQA